MIDVLETIPVINVSSSQRKIFDCGSHALNDFFKRRSESNHLEGHGRTFVLVVDEEIIGYYTVSMSNTLEFLHVKSDKDWPSYPVPIGLVGRLAVSKLKQREGWGKWLLVDAIRRIYRAAQDVGAYAVIVDAKDEAAKEFYLKFGFTPFPNKPMSLYLPMKTIEDLIISK